MFKTKIGLIKYLTLCDIQAREGFDYRNEQEIMTHFKDEVEARTSSAFVEIELLAHENDNYSHVLKGVKAMFSYIFLGFKIQENIIKLWGLKL